MTVCICQWEKGGVGDVIAKKETEGHGRQGRCDMPGAASFIATTLMSRVPESVKLPQQTK